ncbi:2OG-Fe dioxygenase family protein [Pseudomonas sp. Leaf129]|uniref:2OG-Fe dioxygenase family protein n=1 Tax=Pseudomonas sp. Leaf129 TaxID=1736268 RepID=UPI001F35932C|nr:2OG-Fe dioxygenase family protein [Pseudomonas sp. Leaf129]
MDNIHKRAMPIGNLAPQLYTPLIAEVCDTVNRNGFVFLQPPMVAALLNSAVPGFVQGWEDFRLSWGHLDQDAFMGDGGTYRFRRYATFFTEQGSRHWQPSPHQPHYQTTVHNPLNGGLVRHFAPIPTELCEGLVFSAVMDLCCACFNVLAPHCAWHIEVHQFRIDASAGAASPTPEGVHRDGVDFVFMLMVNRVNVVEGETSIYDNDQRLLARHSMIHELEAALLNDAQVRHGVSAIIPIHPDRPAHRDVLVVTFKKR